MSPPRPLSSLAAALLVLLAAPPAALAQHLTDKDAPCQQAAQGAERKQCFITAGEHADQELNATYKAILEKLVEDDQESLRKAERLWIQYRDASCKAESDLYEHEADLQLVYAACIEAETREHTRDLLTIYRSRLEKDQDKKEGK